VAGNAAGGIKARDTNLKKYGKDFYRIQGHKGGVKSRGGGFAYGDHTLAKEAGSTGGKRGKRGFKLLEDLGTKGKYLNKVTNEVVVLSYGS